MAGLARSSFYYHLRKAKTDKYTDIKAKIRMIYNKHKGCYGYRRITIVLRQMGCQINHKTVLRLMRSMSLKSIVRPKKYRSYRITEGRIAPNIIQRDFRCNKPNQKWVTDVTEFKVANKKLYLSPIMDLFNREIISYQIEEKPTFQLVERMLTKGFRRLTDEDKPILHSDQGWQYQMKIYKRALRKASVTQSMSRKGNCLDNAAIESFFAVLKSECFYTRKFTSIGELKKAIHDYIRYYNYSRIKQSLNGLSPVQFRTQSGLT